MRIRVRCFAWAQEITGAEDIELEIPDGGTVAELRDRIAQKFPSLTGKMESLAISVNQEFARDRDVIRPEDEVALIPPISGG